MMSGNTGSSSAGFVIGRRELDSLTTVVSAAGELDLLSAPELKRALADPLGAKGGHVVVDLSQVTFLDSTALGVLVGVKRRLDAGTRLAIVCEHPNVLRIFELTGLLGTFELFSTLELALESFRGTTAAAG